jgi:hypothetical protein
MYNKQELKYEKVIVIKPVTKDLMEWDVLPTEQICRAVGTAVIPKPFWESLKLSMRKVSDGSKTDVELSEEFDKRLVQALGANDTRIKENKKNGCI